MLLVTAVLTLALLAWAGAFKVIPYCALSMFRYRLWRFRDGLADDIRRGSFEDQTQPRIFLRLVETSIENANELSPLNMLLFRLSIVGMREPPRQLELNQISSAKDRERLMGKMAAFERMLIRHAFTGTPSGWFVTLGAVPVAIIATLIAQLRGVADGETLIEGAKEYVSREFETDVAVAVMQGCDDPTPEALAQFV